METAHTTPSTTKQGDKANFHYCSQMSKLKMSGTLPPYAIRLHGTVPEHRNTFNFNVHRTFTLNTALSHIPSLFIYVYTYKGTVA